MTEITAIALIPVISILYLAGVLMFNFKRRLQKIHKFYQGNTKIFLCSFARHMINSLFYDTSLHLYHRSHIELPIDFNYESKLSEPRGHAINNNQHISNGYHIQVHDLPNLVKLKILNYQSIIECYMGAGQKSNVTVLIGKPQIYRNIGIDKKLIEFESIAEFWHQDSGGDLFDMQLFILLSDVSEQNGPLRFIKSNQRKYFRENKSLLSRCVDKMDVEKSDEIIFTGRRGDCILLSTGFTLHKAGIPEPGFYRDIVTIPFTPSYSIYTGIPFSEISA